MAKSKRIEVESSSKLPVIPMRNMTIFPFVFSPLVITRPQSLSALEAALATEEKMLVLVTQRDPNVVEPAPKDLYSIGTKAVIKHLARDGEVAQVLVQGVQRVQLESFDTSEPFLQAAISAVIVETAEESRAREGLRRAIMQLIGDLLRLAHPERAEQIYEALNMAEDIWHLTYLITTLLQLSSEQQQKMLEMKDIDEALNELLNLLKSEVDILQVRNQITEKTRNQLSKQEREYLLRQQLKTIQEELGEGVGGADISDLIETLEKLELPELVRKETKREINRLKQINPSSPDYQLTRSYLELVSELPWNKFTTDDMDLLKARAILDEDHFGLDEIKERILEHLAVMKLNPGSHAPVLCFVGPPGVGKTSLGHSIARALGREFERLSLGGLSDESELRGHRRTYIGAMPGRLIQAIRRAAVMNPLLMLDEIDKLGRDMRGDPASAMLEILDPAQNHTFRDNYLDMPFDLSRVFFIATANTLDSIPGPLLDRMEVIQLSGYTTTEKLEIAKRYLIPRQISAKGLAASQSRIDDETILSVIRKFTRESGVRQLERAFGKLARKIALKVASFEEVPTISGDNLDDLLGKQVRRETSQRKRLPCGVATGLAWTQTGGEVLYIESVLLPDAPGLTLTGQLGDVMRESARAAQSYLWSHADKLKLDADKIKRNGVHLHVPAGAIPKDGPSAGVTMITALCSLYSNTPARSDTAMTGEITLSGDILAIGGVKEKSLAAHAAGIRRLVLPIENEVDARDIPPEIREQLQIYFVDHVDQLLEITLDHASECDSQLQAHAKVPSAAAKS
ncbi:MAG TPA: endopeptidase La [Pirellulaceae bacterium]|nr:endopeptidase La [Pirellulaceae bacterium]HMO93674.1 endopeptidase La [Pirellulaceae bacterium]HMP68416.1 endopeptidase La [Pirellulaceae bacterium]